MRCFEENSARLRLGKGANLVFACLAGATALGLLAGCLLLSGSHSLTALFAYVVLGGFVLALEAFTWHAFVLSSRRTPYGTADPSLLAKVVGIALLSSVALEALTLFGATSASPLAIGDWNVLRIVLFFFLSYMVLMLGLFCSKRKLSQALPVWVRAVGKDTAVRALAAVVGCGALALCAAFALQREADLSFVSIFAFSFAIFGCIVSFLFAWRRASGRPEWLFFPAALLLGSYLALIPPAVTNISWDDQVHFKQSLALSYVVNSEYSDADATLFNPLIEDGQLGRPYIGDNWVADDRTWSQSDIDSYHERMNEAHEAAPYHVAEGFSTAPPAYTVASYASVGYVPSALGLWLGRVLHLPFEGTFALGRWMNLLAYCIASFVAIRIIPVKKVLLCGVALLPTNLFMAANYSYDPWLVSFLFLAVALLVREICTPDAKMTGKRWAIILVVFFLALGPKAIYFPLIGLLFLMPKCKFRSSNQRRLFFGSAILLIFAVMASFLLPFVASGAASSGDVRGGSDVSAVGQVGYILSDPVGYAQTLFGFLVNHYLTIGASAEYTVWLAYFGRLDSVLPWFAVLPVVFLLFLAVSDSDRLSWYLCKAPVIIWTAFLLVLTVCLIATSLYVSFTPVGLDTVRGCQLRYLLPLVFPFMALCFNFKLQNRIRRSRYNMACVLLSCVPVVLCCWFLVASKIYA